MTNGLFERQGSTRPYTIFSSGRASAAALLDGAEGEMRVLDDRPITRQRRRLGAAASGPS